MAPSNFPSHLLSHLSSAQTGTDSATDALEEWILHRRAKGDTLFDVSVGLAELEDRTPPHLTAAFDRARYVTNVPQPTDLTPPMGPFPLARSASPQTILHHLLSQPPPSIEHSREVILEYVLAREAKLREKKSGRGGKGTLGRDGFEEIGRRLAEVEDGLRGETSSSLSPKRSSGTMSTSSSGREAYPTPRSDSAQSFNENQQIGLTLILSLRMSLSYFTLQELANQLLLLALGDAERTLVQHIRRRVPGEGRWGIGKELEYVEGLTLTRRPALRPAFRSAKARTQLPGKPLYPIQLPAPSKSSCIKLLSSMIKEVDAGGPVSAASYILAHTPASPALPNQSPSAERSYFLSKRGASASPTTSSAFRDGSPQTPLSALPPPLNSPGAPAKALPDPNIITNYTMELVSEFLTREKREHILKSKWAKSGRDQLGKELGEIESAVCLVGKNKPSHHAPTLLPVFLLLRRTFALPPSTLHPSITEPYLDILPAPPDPDDVPFREPTVSTITASLYVNPRLEDASAMAFLEELVEFEKEGLESAGASREEAAEWLENLIDSVQKRFPDGSYARVFESMKERVTKPPAATPVAQSISFAKQPSIHRRAKSSAVTPGSASEASPGGEGSLLSTPNMSKRQQHSRSYSMPNRQSTYDQSDSSSDSDDSPAQAQIQMQQRPAVVTSIKQLPPLQMLSPIEMDDEKRASAATSGGGWWDIVSAMDNDNPAPWQEPLPPRRPTSQTHTPRSSSGRGSVMDLPLPPGAEPAQILDFSAPMLTDMAKLDLSPSHSPNKAVNVNAGNGNDSGIGIAREYDPSYQRFSQGHSSPNGSPNARAHTMGARVITTPEPLSSGVREGPKSTGPGSAGYLNERLPPPPLRFEKPAPSPTGSASASRSHTNSPSHSYMHSVPARTSSSGVITPMQSPNVHGSTTSAAGSPSYPVSPFSQNAARSSPSPAAAISAQAPPGPPFAPAPSPASAPHKSKLGVLGRSMSYARHKKDKEKDKENNEKEKDKGKERDKEKGKKSGKGVQNDPGRWNRDMVANIMGPPADRR
ncbi:hypothetical protein I316_02512 [Kwoniella heveanensis BCC8398]|uniref:Uncharacterized protein n=1 Tax=Kwoniella heveanensis BCC8398 TaxID=1296120 RepID=A0A1B9GYA6_9TREE|nr:hypothetical protein I316_02512 [Kwoniella heveanensis BCC8398]